ncbi:MAG: cell wall-binding repeat-containing protein [Anaerolineae bacterium]|nr:cell wall-binding repeat-containing protein [Anaerolineae bacterium]
MMRNLVLSAVGLITAVIVLMVAGQQYEKVSIPSIPPGEMMLMEDNMTYVTVNTTRIGSDDPVETAVAVSQIIYPVTEEENSPGAVILINQHELAEAIVAASRVQHFPVNAPLLYVDEEALPDLTRKELLRLKPEGVPMDGNTQVYLIGTISDKVRQEVEEMGYEVRVLTADNPIELAQVVDNWTSTQHGDFRNEIVIMNIDSEESLLAGLPSAFWNAHRGDAVAFVTNEGIPETTREMLERRANGPWIYLFGDENIISAEIARELAQYGHVTRIPGSDPEAVSAHFAAFKDEGKDWSGWLVLGARTFGWGIGEAGHNAIFVNIYGPGGWQNAITATTLSHMGKHAPVLFVGRDVIPQAVQTYLEVTRPYPTAPQQQLLNHGWIIGGEGTMSWETQAQLDLYLDAYLTMETEES